MKFSYCIVKFENIFFKFLIVLFTILFCVIGTFCSNSKNDNKVKISQSQINIIPEPVLVQSKHGNFRLTPNVIITCDNEQKDIINISNLLSKSIEDITGKHLEVNPTINDKDYSIHLGLLSDQDETIGSEGYVLEIKPSKIYIRANKPAGIFNGVQSFIQLLPESFKNNEMELNIPCVYIKDFPRFSWRGLLFDAAHWWYEIEDLRKFIDQMAKYKYNTLTLHLTNDNAWRIEIKAYPKLNEIGSWRVPRTGTWNTFDPPQPGEEATYGGYYTQEQLKELVKYASERFVTIVPKIELPGHMGAFIASYPATSCSGLQYYVNPGSRRKYGEIPYEMCAGKESNFEMIDKILDEYVEIFPSEYIHIGGDEVNFSFWKNCPLCKKRMLEENLKSVEELQSYVIRRVEKMLKAKGRKLIGWDEILKGGLAPDATVMSWRGMAGGIEAAKMKHYVVMAPNTFTYFDYKQTDRTIIPEAACWGYLPLSTTYKWDPVPLGADPQYILGGQGQLWTEFMPHLRQIEYMTWPRAMALSEVLWSPRKERDIDEFLSRVETHFPRFDKEQVKYATSIYDPIITPVKNVDGNMELMFSSEVKGLDIYYTFDGTIPDNFSNEYKQGPITIPKGASQVWVVTYRNGERIGKWLSISIEELQKRLSTD